MSRVDDALETIDRASFLPKIQRHYAAIDRPIQIGFEQTNSQPSTVRLMLEWLDVQEGNKVLDVGAGSGWTSALLAWLVGPKGQVFAVERIPELVKFGQQNCKQAGIKNVQFFEADKELGLVQFAPYDRILVSAAANKLPQDLVAQLRYAGRIVIPVKNSIFVIDKLSDGMLETQEFSGFMFVPLVG